MATTPATTTPADLKSESRLLLLMVRRLAQLEGEPVSRKRLLQSTGLRYAQVDFAVKELVRARLAGGRAGLDVRGLPAQRASRRPLHLAGRLAQVRWHPVPEGAASAAGRHGAI